MEPIKEGATGVAVEDIQERLVSIGYEIAQDELDSRTFGSSTARAVARFRLDHDLDLAREVDTSMWQALVDECYELGDRTLYLRLPNFHGRDVRQLQERLTVLGFSCGSVDGYFGAYTEAAVKEFQESVGLMADGMAFQSTFDAIERLKHVWGGKPADGPHPHGGIGFARAASVLEGTAIAITGDDPIARNVAGRVWNLASATTDNSGLSLINDAADAPEGTTVVLVVTSHRHRGRRGPASVSVDDVETLPLRLRTAIQSSLEKTPVVRIELPVPENAYGSFTVGDAQTFAVMLLDAICVTLQGL